MKIRAIKDFSSDVVERLRGYVSGGEEVESVAVTETSSENGGTEASD